MCNTATPPLSSRTRYGIHKYLYRFRVSARNDKKGFTLVELLVVITIIAILSVIGVTVFSGVQKNARDAQRRGDLHAIVTALEVYKSVNGRYPDPTNGSRGGWGDSDLNPTDYIKNLNSSFASGALPVDPINNLTYHYSYYRYNLTNNNDSNYAGCKAIGNVVYVVGIRWFENSTSVGGFKCANGRNWGDEFHMAIGNYE